MFNITLKLTRIEAVILETFLHSRGKTDLQRGKIFSSVNHLIRGTLLLEVAAQIEGQANRSVLPDVPVPFPDAPPATYTQVLDGLIKELSDRTVESDEHNDWSRVLRSTADQLEELYLKANSWR